VQRNAQVSISISVLLQDCPAHSISALKSPSSLSKQALHHCAHHSLTSLSRYPQHCKDTSATGLQVALELGSYIGYSAITQARILPAGGKLYGIELDPTNVRITQEMVQHAGLSHKVEILKGDLESSILVGLLTQHASMSSLIFCNSDAKHSRSTLSLLATRPQDCQSIYSTSSAHHSHAKSVPPCLFARQQHCLIPVMPKWSPCCHALQELHKRGVITVDYVLIDHVYWCFLKDLLLLQHNGMLRKGSVVVADNVLLPGAPDYRRYVNTSADFSTVEHIVDLPASYCICDIMTVSEFLGSG